MGRRSTRLWTLALTLTGSIVAAALALILALRPSPAPAQSPPPSAPAAPAPAEPAAADRVRLFIPGGGELLVEASGGSLGIEPSTYHPRFGSSLPSSVLRLELGGAECFLRMDF